MSNMKHLIVLFGAGHAHSDKEKLEATQMMLTSAVLEKDQLPIDSHIPQKERLLLDSDPISCFDSIAGKASHLKPQGLYVHKDWLCAKHKKPTGLHHNTTWLWCEDGVVYEEGTDEQATVTCTVPNCLFDANELNIADGKDTFYGHDIHIDGGKLSVAPGTKMRPNCKKGFRGDRWKGKGLSAAPFMMLDCDENGKGSWSSSCVPHEPCKIGEINILPGTERKSDTDQWNWYNFEDGRSITKETLIAHGDVLRGHCFQDLKYQDLKPFTMKCHDGLWIKSRKCHEPEFDPAFCGSLEGTWMDSQGDNCDVYKNNNYCKSEGMTIKSMKSLRKDGHSALTACCGCAADKGFFPKCIYDGEKLNFEGGIISVKPGQYQAPMCKEGFQFDGKDQVELDCSEDGQKSDESLKGCQPFKSCKIRDIGNWKWYKFDKMEGPYIGEIEIAHREKVSGHCYHNQKRFTKTCYNGKWNYYMETKCLEPVRKTCDLSSENGLTDDAKSRLGQHAKRHSLRFQLCKGGYEQSPEISQFEAKYANKFRLRAVICLDDKLYALAGSRSNQIAQEVSQLCVEVPIA